MKKFKRSICFSLIGLTIMTALTSVVNASEFQQIDNNTVDKVQIVESSELLSGIDKIVIKDYIYVDNVETPLYKVFEDQEQALQDLKNKIPNFINLLKNTYSLSELNDSSLDTYVEKAYQYISESQNMNEASENFKILRSFIDIYENTEENEKIIDYTSKKRSTLSSKDVTLITMLPYNSEVVQNFNTEALNTSTKLTQARAYNQNAAIDYARQYALNPNHGPYHYFGIRGDCTNFTSQILEAAGVAQEVYDSEYMGWWHRKEWTGWHSHSNSWVGADTFARYMGIGYSTTNHASFAANIRTGDFIGLDIEDDGSIDHCGFVVGKDNYVGGWGYYNYEVAQHSTNYIKWASESDNSWDTYSGSGKYVRIRR